MNSFTLFFMDSRKNIHIGSVIKKVFTEKSMTITEFANKINRDRTSVYNIFKRKSIDPDFLISISEALNYDFLNEVYFPEKTIKKTSKILIAIEIDESEFEKLNLPDEFVRLVRLGK